MNGYTSDGDGFSSVPAKSDSEWATEGASWQLEGFTMMQLPGTSIEVWTRQLPPDESGKPVLDTRWRCRGNVIDKLIMTAMIQAMEAKFERAE